MFCRWKGPMKSVWMLLMSLLRLSDNKCFSQKPITSNSTLQLQEALFHTNMHEHNNKIYNIMLCLETLIKLIAYCLHKNHQFSNDEIKALLNTTAYDQTNKTALSLNEHILSQTELQYINWPTKDSIVFENIMSLVPAKSVQYKPVIGQMVDCAI